jgi:hypothetical protein
MASVIEPVIGLLPMHIDGMSGYAVELYQAGYSRPCLLI